MSREKCYRCGRKAVSREHVPPLCLFPSSKDFPDKNYRKNLITVPACKFHNEDKTNEDEFLMMNLAGVVGNNAVGFLHNATKVRRALDYKSSGFIQKVVRNATHHLIEGNNGIKFPMLLGNPDYPRLEKSLKLITYGLYYHAYGSVFQGEVRMLLGHLKYKDDKTEKIKRWVARVIQHQAENNQLKYLGANPEVFQFAFAKPDMNQLIAAHLIFYEGVDVYVAFRPKCAEQPFDFTMASINNGWKTIIRLDDNETIEFN